MKTHYENSEPCITLVGLILLAALVAIVYFSLGF